jgi:hypothetical protein
MHGDDLNADFSQVPTEISLAEGFHEASPMPDTNAPAPHPFFFKHIEGQRNMFEAWSKANPVDRWERLRDRRIEAVQGNKNSYVR